MCSGTKGETLAGGLACQTGGSNPEEGVMVTTGAATRRPKSYQKD